jgi:hypothetical protein
VGEAAKVVLGADVGARAQQDKEAEAVSEAHKALEVGEAGPRELAGVGLVHVPAIRVESGERLVGSLVRSLVGLLMYFFFSSSLTKARRPRPC